MATYTRVLHRSSGSERLLNVLLVVGAAWTKSAINYWTITVRRVASGQTYGEDVGAAYDMATRDLIAWDPVTIYTSDSGLELNDGDILIASLAETGSPITLTDAKMQLQLQKIAR